MASGWADGNRGKEGKDRRSKAGSLFFSAMGKRSVDQAESEADEDLGRMSKSSCEQHSLSSSEIEWRERISAQGASEKFTMIVVSTSMGSPLSRVGR